MFLFPGGPAHVTKTPAFVRHAKHRLDDESLAELVRHLELHPDAGDVMGGTGGVRKLRWAASGRGKSGSFRVLYYWHTSARKVVLLALYAKNEWDEPPAWLIRQWLKSAGN